MATVFDTTHDCSKAAANIRAQGFTTLIRYYCRPDLTWKRITQSEAISIAQAGLSLVAVYQNRQNQDGDFSEAKGEAAGRDAYDFAENVIAQPADSAIYFSADYDPSEAAIRDNIVPFFEGVHAAFEQASKKPLYKVGIYGSGRTCRILLEKNLVDYTWITQSTGFAEYKKFLASGKWNLKQLMPSAAGGLDGDPNDTNPDNPDFGAFDLDLAAFGPAAAPAAMASAASDQFTVIASAGLRIRTGPGVEFDIRSTLPVGARVGVLSRAGDWAMVDVNGDGTADGFVLAAYLTA